MNDPATVIDPTPGNMHTCVQKVATGPEYSKDLSFAQARAAMDLILRGEADPVQAAIFLIALRMKRETDDENRGVLQAILDRRELVEAPVDEIMDVADPYNGQVRGLPAAPFLPPLLAACGVPAVSHGVEAVGPKYGITHHQVLAAAGIDVRRTSREVAEQLAQDQLGWGYIDQSQSCPSLHNLIDLRDRIIKRTVITTVEVMSRPISGRKKTHLLTGYVHKAYPPVYADLARFAGFDTAAIVKGVEGGVIPSLQQPSRYYRMVEGEDDQFVSVEPTALGIDQPKRAIPLPDDAKSIQDASDSEKSRAVTSIAEQGVDALRNQPGAARDSLMYAAAIALLHLGRQSSLVEAARQARDVLASGEAYARFTAHQ